MTSILDNFLWVIGLLHKAMGTHVRSHRQDDAVLGVAFWHADRIRRRFVALYTRWTQGTLKPIRKRQPAESSLPPRSAGGAGGGPTPPETAPKPAKPKTPRRRGWVTHMAPPCAEAGSWLHYFLQRDDMPAFLAAVPRAGRLLRPLCHMLGVPLPEYLKLPKRPRKPRRRKPRPQYGHGGKYPRLNPLRYSPGRIPAFRTSRT